VAGKLAHAKARDAVHSEILVNELKSLRSRQGLTFDIEVNYIKARKPGVYLNFQE
jgi:hypothetical protein